MKPATALRRLSNRLNFLILFGFLLVGVVGLALPTVHSSSVNKSAPIATASAENHGTPKVMPAQLRQWNWLSTIVHLAAAGESVTLYAADCSTPKTGFVVGETVCAKTDGVDLTTPGNYYMNWIDSQLNITGGGTITQNPQYFLFSPPTAGTYKATIGSVTPADSSIVGNPPLFTVTGGVGLGTYASDCTTPQTSFNLGQTVCVKTAGGAGQSRVQLINPAGYSVARENIDASPDTISFILPTATTFDGGDFTFDNRGPWHVTLVDNPSAGVRFSAKMTVHDPAQTVANLQVVKTLLGSANPTPGSNIQAAVRVFNGGPDAASSVQFTDVLPANTTFVSLTQTSGPAFNCTTPSVGGVGTSLCTASTLAANTAADFLATYQVNGSVGNLADLSTSASATSNTAETSAVDNSSSSTATASNPAPSSCTISCPANITTTAALGQSGATVTFSNPTLSGSCSSVSVTPVSGSFFAIGTSVVTATTEAGETCSFTVTVNPADDAEAPTISCPGDITVDESSPSANTAIVTYNVSATDNSGSANVSCDPPSGSSFAIGTHAIVCTATDASGNTNTCTFNVTVNQIGCDLDANSPAPTPNIASLPTINAACSVTLLPQNDPTATDACGATINGDTTDDRAYDSPGTYTVHWTYTDSAGHISTQDQTIIIQPDNTAPVPDVASLPTATGECSVSLTAPTATDNCAGTLTGTTANMVVSGAGTHTVVWTYTDNAGNTTQQNQTVVVTDTSAPVVTLTGSSSVTVECHTSYTDAGATASDNCLGAMTPTANSNVDVNTPGTYQVVWSATDGGNNTGTATRTVNVVDTTAPVITLNGANPITVILGSTFTDPGATANDSCAASFAATASGSVNTNVIGSYTITYNATDPSGNAAIAVTRTVKVIYNFTGFFSPIGNPPTLNSVNAGRGIPVKFSLSGNQGLNIFAANNPYSVSFNCASNDPGVDVSETLTAGGSSLSYSPDTYTYVWKTESSWAGTCRQLVITLNDGTVHTANFKFK